MFYYTIKRLAYSVFIIVGVILLTFVLFNLASGDPAAAVLGKNATPEEIEKLRIELGADLPMFFGDWRSTEAFSSAAFDRPLDWSKRNIEIVNGAVEDGHLNLFSGSVSFRRNFTVAEPLFLRLEYSGSLECDGRKFFSDQFTELELPLAPDAESITLSGTSAIRDAAFGRKQSNRFDSRFIHALSEVVSFSSTPPYVSFLDFGRSITTREPIKDILKRGVLPSLCLMVPIFLGELVIGIILALFATAYQNTLIDRTLVIFSVAGMSVSYLVVILFAQWYLGYYCGLFPVWGWGSVRYLYLPVIVGIVCGLGGSVRFYRTVFVNELNKEYLRTAAAKGCSRWSIYGRHLLRNAMIPIITQATTTLPFLFTGSLLLETFFGIPGLGFAGVDALNNSDLQQLKALVIVSAGLFILLNLLGDLAYAWADPRIRLDDR